MIEIKDGLVSLSRDGRRKLAVSLRLSKGDFAILLGRNGSGKTTVLDTLAGIHRLDSGVLSVDAASLPIGYVVQDSASGLLPWRTILSNILLPCKLLTGIAAADREKAIELLSAFDLCERKDDFPYRLSEGEKQIVNLIRAMSTPASILLLDEPFASLNAKARLLAKKALCEVARGRTTILVTHDPIDLDLPIARRFLITDLTVNEITTWEAKEFLENVAQRP